MPRTPDEQSDELLTSKATAQLLGYAPGTLENLRAQGRGPKWMRINGRSIRYRRSDIDAWLADQEHSSPSVGATA